MTASKPSWFRNGVVLPEGSAVISPFLLYLSTSLNTTVAFLIVAERVEKLWRRSQKLAARRAEQSFFKSVEE